MLVLSALDLAFIPVDVVLLMASTLPTPVLARLLTWLVALCAAVLRLALLDVAEPRAAVEMKVDSKGGSGVSAHGEVHLVSHLHARITICITRTCNTRKPFIAAGMMMLLRMQELQHPAATPNIAPNEPLTSHGVYACALNQRQ